MTAALLFAAGFVAIRCLATAIWIVRNPAEFDRRRDSDRRRRETARLIRRALSPKGRAR